jgi:hypothetical protein
VSPETVETKGEGTNAWWKEEICGAAGNGLGESSGAG